MKLRVRKSDGHTHAFWASESEAAQLIRAGLAKSYGTRRRVHGLVLTCDIDQAGSHLFGPLRSGSSRKGYFREHVAERFYLYQPAAPGSPAAAHIALA